METTIKIRRPESGYAFDEYRDEVSLEHGEMFITETGDLYVNNDPNSKSKKLSELKPIGELYTEDLRTALIGDSTKQDTIKYNKQQIDDEVENRKSADKDLYGETIPQNGAEVTICGNHADIETEKQRAIAAENKLEKSITKGFTDISSLKTQLGTRTIYSGTDAPTSTNPSGAKEKDLYFQIKETVVEENK